VLAISVEGEAAPLPDDVADGDPLPSPNGPSVVLPFVPLPMSTVLTAGAPEPDGS
jgi:hypothetical protein